MSKRAAPLDAVASEAAPAGAGGPRRWWRWLRTALAVLGLAAIVAYLVHHRDSVRDLPELDLRSWAWLFAITAAGTALSVWSVQRMLAALGTRTRFGEMFLLHNAAQLLNLLPLKAGTVLRGTYLRSRHGFTYPRFGVFLLYLTLLTTLVTAGVGLACLVASYGLGPPVNRLFAALLAASLVATGAALLLPLPVPAWTGRTAVVLRDLLGIRRELLRRRRSLAAPAAGLLVVYLLGVLRLGVIYHGLGLAAEPAGLLLLGALGQLSLLANLTPAGLGVRELLLGTGATVLGIPVEAGLLAALIERAVALLWSGAVGAPSVVQVWRLQRRGAEAAAPDRGATRPPA